MTDNDFSRIDWSTGEILFEATQGDDSQALRVVIAGDWVPNFSQTQNFPEIYAPFGDLAEVLRDSKIGILNFEGVVPPKKAEEIIKDGISISFDEKYIQSLRATGFNLACLANNHTMDYGLEGLSNTVKILKQNHIDTIGAGFTSDAGYQPFIYTWDHFKICIINVAEGEEGKAQDQTPGVAFLDLAYLRDLIRKLKEESTFVILIVHAGREYIRIPPPYILDCYHKLVEYGADLIVGHHPHVHQGIEIFKGTPIFYSLGNFTLYEPGTSQFQRVGFLVQCLFQKTGLSKIKIWPFNINENALQLLSEQQKEHFLLDLKELSELIWAKDKLEALWNAFTDRWYFRNGMTELIENAIILNNNLISLQAVLRGVYTKISGNSIREKIFRRGVMVLMKTLGKVASSSYTENGNFRPQKTLQNKIYYHSVAVLRNRFDTLAHRELYLNIFKRIIDGAIGNSPSWAVELIEKWELP